MAWTQLLGLNSGIENWQTAAEALDRQFGVDRPLLRDTAPYNTLERFAMWLGVTAVSAGNSSPIRPRWSVRALDALVQRPACSASELLRRSAERFPWLPHGRLGRAFAEHMRSVPDGSAADGRFPEGLSLALVRLEQENAIVLDAGDDPKSRVLLSFGGAAGAGISRGWCEHERDRAVGGVLEAGPGSTSSSRTSPRRTTTSSWRCTRRRSCAAAACPCVDSAARMGLRQDQQDLLEHFLGPAPEERTLIVPLIGAPGIGKSHLIRWLKARSRSTATSWCGTSRARARACRALSSCSSRTSKARSSTSFVRNWQSFGANSTRLTPRGVWTSSDSPDLPDGVAP